VWPEGDAQKIGCYIGRILTPCRTPVPPLPARTGRRHYLKVAEYADLLNMTEQVRKVTQRIECLISVMIQQQYQTGRPSEGSR